MCNGRACQSYRLAHSNIRKIVLENYKNETVSVIIPVYNAERFLNATLDSVVNQTYDNLEVVMVDDCSKDRSKEIIEGYCAKYPFIKYHRLDGNKGAAVARNTALNIASGRYVAFLDADDVWEKDKLTRQLSHIKEKDAAFCFAAIDFINENGDCIKPRRDVKEVVDYTFLLTNTMIATSTVVVDRNKTGKFQMPLRRGGQDYATWLMLMRTGVKAYGINEVLSHYRITPGSLSSNKLKSIRQVWEIQTQNENINKVRAMVNVMLFVLNALKKYFT